MAPQLAQEIHGSVLHVDMQTLIDAHYPTGASGGVEVRRLKFSPYAFQNMIALALRTEIAQGFGIVAPGLIMARHIFRGLKRGIHDGSGEDQGPKKLVYSWKPAFDCLWFGDRFSGRIERISPPKNRVFVVIVSPNDAVDVGTPAGFIDRWNWVDEDSLLKEEPVYSTERYGERIWTRR